MVFPVQLYDFMCISPIYIKNKGTRSDYGYHRVPCSACYQCRLRRGAGWSLRLRYEEKVHSTAYFVTFTYDDDNLPVTDDGVVTLSKRHLQLYFKRLRKRHSNAIKYYACGEYGSNTYRPHYHCIMFGANEDLISLDWHYGHVRIDPCTPRTISYVCGYVNKPRNVFEDGREKEFSLMSKKLGINYLTDAKVNWHVNKMVGFAVLEGGIKTPLPRYFRDKIFDEQQKDVIAAINTSVRETNENRLIIQKGYDRYIIDAHESVNAAIRNQSNKYKTKRNKL